MLRFQLDSDVCSADLHHNPRKHVGLHAPQRLHRLPEDGLSGRPRLRVTCCGFHTGGRPGWALARLAREPSERRASHGPLCTYVRTSFQNKRGSQCTCVPFSNQKVVYVRTYVPLVRTYNVMSQLSDWKRAHMCTEYTTGMVPW
jgi:hypothetical protein